MDEIDLTELRKQCITSLFVCTENASKYLDTEKEVQLNKLKKCVQQYCALEAEQMVAIEAKEKAKAETDTTNIETLDTRYQSYLKSLAKNCVRVDNHPYMLEFSNRYKKGLQAAKNTVPDDSDLAINELESQDQYIDPISKRPITDPVRNTLCGHIYDKQTIMEVIRKNNKIRCPMFGCGNRTHVIAAHLISDEELKFRMSIPVHSTMIQERSIMDLDETA